MTCNKEKCLICKHSKVGDPCNDKTLSFKESSLRDLSDKFIVYKIKEDYLTEQINKAKSRNADKEKASKDLKAYRRNLKETIKIKECLAKEINSCQTLKTSSLFSVGTVKI